MANVTAPHDPIIELLDAVMRRRRIRAALRVGVAGLIGGLALLVAGLASNHLGWFAADPMQAFAIGLVVAASFAGLVIARTAPTELATAFAIDRTENFREAYGTAVELIRKPGGQTNPVVAEFFDRIRRTVGPSAPDRLVRLVTPGLTLALIAALLLGGAAWGLARMPVPDRPALALEQLVEPDPLTAETVAALAERLAEDAERRDDSLLAAIANELAQRAEAAGSSDLSDALASDVDDLLSQAAAAYGDAVPDWLANPSGSSLDEEASETAEAVPGMPTGPLDPTRSRNDVLASEQGPGLYEARPELAEMFADRNADETLASGAVTSSAETPLDLGGSSSGDMPQLMQPDELQSIGSIPVGAALDSGRGLSNAAGLGQEDFQIDDAFAHLDAAPGEDMTVSAETQAGGSRIRIDMVPETSDAAVAGAANAIAPGAGHGTAGSTARDYVPANAREIAARYFERAAQ
ncbi:MAG TPA: hypothetical protein VNS12_07860 [Pelagibacterium sp.]|uniref:hypothetical protein n=1 Tax=Pelagibacterium sp. TaxID=1967288 RepID=UPI002B59C37A|nr:hypothetical protein [Pelagibacterium sp.]HWJ87968.1 hypothetical protein [Pelagibacterium sp.]